MFVPFCLCFSKNIAMYYINIYLSLFQVLSDVRTAVHWYEHMSTGKCKFHYPNSFTIHKISWKYWYNYNQESMIDKRVSNFRMYYQKWACKVQKT